MPASRSHVAGLNDERGPTDDFASWIVLVIDIIAAYGGVERKMDIRAASDEDMMRIAEIYGHEVANGVATFEEEVPSSEELNRRRRSILEIGLPYLVAEDYGRVVGYSYASSYRPRAAYRYTVENTVYVAQEARGRGIAETLLKALINRCELADRRQMIAVIAVTGDPDKSASIALHRKLLFRRIGTVEGSGFKHGQWVDTVLMQRTLGNGKASPPRQVGGRGLLTGRGGDGPRIRPVSDSHRADVISAKLTCAACNITVYRDVADGR